MKNKSISPSVTVNRSKISGISEVPSSKSHSLRAVLFASFAKGTSRIKNLLKANDTKSMIQACQSLGAIIEEYKNHTVITGIAGNIQNFPEKINAGNSGIVLRFLSAVGALGNKLFTVTGDHSICHNRPMKELIEPLKMLGADVLSVNNNDYAPLNIKGPIKPGKACLKGKDSQPVSALLIAASLSVGDFEFDVSNAGEKPWIDLTLSWLDKLGVKYCNNQYSNYRISGKGVVDAFDYTVPGDVSSASFLVAAAIITNSSITLQNVDLEDPQGDKLLFTYLKQMGANICYNEQKKELLVGKREFLKGIELDINPCIDAIVILSVIACFAEGETVIKEGAVAREKECNRIEAIALELANMGANIKETSDGLIVKKSILRGAVVNSHNDHRMAMSLIVAGFGAHGKTVVRGVDCINKTYPNFIEELISLGAQIKRDI